MACLKRPLINIAKRSYCAAAAKINVVPKSTDEYATKVSLVYDAGSRYETPSNLGVTHAVRTALAWGNPNNGIDAALMSYSTESSAVNLAVTTTREQLIYTFEGLIKSKDDFKEAVALLMTIGGDAGFTAINADVGPFLSAIKHELAVYAQSPALQLAEAAHKAAFGMGGLANSIYMPSYAVGSHSHAMINDFMSEFLVPANATVVVSGVEGADAFDLDKKTEMGMRATKPASVYRGGEMRIEGLNKEPLAAILFEGANWNSKDRVALNVLAQVLGTGEASMKFNEPSTLITAASPVPCKSSVLNYNYSDAGLFGVVFSANCTDMGKVADATVATLANLKSGGITQADVDSAKAKAAVATAHSSLHDVAVTSLKVGSQAIDAELSAIHSITLSQVQNVAKKVLSTAPSMAATGDLRTTPFLKNVKL